MQALLATKTHVPRIRSSLVVRQRLMERIDRGTEGRMTLVSAPAGFGKSTLVSAWAASSAVPTVWVALDEGDRDARIFLTYIIEALQTLSEVLGASVAVLLQAPSPPPTEELVKLLVNDLCTWPDRLVLVLDDYHLAASDEVNTVVSLLLEHLPPRVHVVITTRQDPAFPLARLRASGQLTEVRQDDLRFTSSEAVEFFTRVGSLRLTDTQVAALEHRTEGWAAGLQLAALSLAGQPDVSSAIASFVGTNRFVQDYLFEEVLGHQRFEVQDFLVRTSALDRFCAPLCDALLERDDSREILAALDQANLFLVALDAERRWYRYHQLFADLLRQRLQTLEDPDLSHRRASQWYENEGNLVDAFREAVAAGDVDLANRLAAGNGMPLVFQGEMGPVIQWVRSLPPQVRQRRPEVEVKFAWALLLSGRHGQVEEVLAGAEMALGSLGSSREQDDLWGQIFTLRAFVATAHHQAEPILPLAEKALGLLADDNHAARSAAQCALGVGFQFRGDRDAAKAAFGDLVLSSRRSGNRVFTVGGSIALANLLVSENQLVRAEEIFRYVVETVDDPANTLNCEAYLGLARIHCEWNDLDAVDEFLRQAITLAGQIDCDTGLAAEALRARMLLVRGDPHVEGVLLQALDLANRQNLTLRASDLARWLVVVYVRTGKLSAASRLAPTHRLCVSQARVLQAQGNSEGAQALLDGWLETEGPHALPEDRLPILIALALARRGDKATEALALALHEAEPGRMLRPFLDEGQPMADLLRQPRNQALGSPLVEPLLQALSAPLAARPLPAGLTERLSEREAEILDLMAQGLSNEEIGTRLFLSLSTIKWHNQNLFGKLQVQRRTEAIAKARSLGLLAN